MSDIVTPPVDYTKFVLDGFKSVPELWELSTPELLNTEMTRLVQVAQKSNLDANGAFFEAQKRALNLLKQFNQIELAEQRRLDKANQKQLRLEQAAERERIAAEAKIELKEIVDQLASQPGLSPASKSALEYFRYIYLENKRDPEIASIFKGTTRDQRYQWKRRSIDMVEPLASPTAKKYISERTKRKFASFDDLVKYADIYLFRTMETI